MVANPNPPHLRCRLTRAQIRKKFPSAYETQSFTYGMQYYVSARFAAAAHLMPVAAALAHHALEAMLKACSAQNATKQQILRFGDRRKSFGHDLVKLWGAFVVQYPKAKHYGFRKFIRDLDKFEKIRFAEQLIQRQTMISTSFSAPGKQPPQPRMRRFTLRMDLLDKLVRTIFETAGVSAQFYLMNCDGQESAHYYKLRNRFQFRT